MLQRGGQVDAGAGGVVNAAAAASGAVLEQRSHVNIGRGVKMTVFDIGYREIPDGALKPEVAFRPEVIPYDPFAPNAVPGNLRLRAYNALITDDQATLQTGGLIQIPQASSRVVAELETGVSIADKAFLFTTGDLHVSAYAMAAARATALSSTAGVAGGASGHSRTSVVSNHHVNVGKKVHLIAHGDVALAAGRSADGVRNSSVLAQALSRVFNYTAIPAETDPYAEADVHHFADVSIGRGSRVAAVFDVTIAASDDDIRAVGDGIGVHPYTEIGLASEINDGHSSETRSGTVAIDGTVTSGIWHRQEVDIAKDGNSYELGPTTVDLEVKLGDFNPHQELVDQITALQQLLKGDLSNDERNEIQGQIDVLQTLLAAESEDPKPAAFVSPMFAAGGNVVLHGRTIGGSGSVTALGGPSIAINNPSDRYLVLDSLYIPERDSGGAVLFTGPAARADVHGELAGRLAEVDREQQARITVNNTLIASEGPGVFLTGPVSNLTGLVRVFNRSGNIGQFAEIRAQSIQLESPNGTYIANLPGQHWWATGDPVGQWAHWEQLPSDARFVAELALSADLGRPFVDMLDDNPYFWVEYLFNEYLRDPLGKMYPDGGSRRSDPNGYTWVFTNFPNCFETFEKCTEKAATPWDYREDLGLYIWLFGDITSSSGRHFWMRHAPVHRLTRSAGYDDAAPKVDGDGVLAGGSIAINARYIDINGVIRSGIPGDRKIYIHPDAEAWAADRRAEWLRTQGDDAVEIPLSAALYSDSAGPGNRLRIMYRPATDEFVLDPINASGGGYVYLNGHIMSTNQEGNIQVLTDYGHVSIRTDSERHLVVGDIHTGDRAISEVVIVDTATSRTNWYVHEIGGGITHYQAHGLLTERPADLAPTNHTIENFMMYQPLKHQRYAWTRKATVKRDYSQTGFYEPHLFSDWYWVPQGKNNELWSTTRSVLLNKPGLPDVEQTMSGKIKYISGLTWRFADHYKNVPDGDWSFRVIDEAELSVTTSVRADYPFKISFIGNDEGKVDINSRAGMTLAGTIDNTRGDTTLRAVGAGQGIGQTADALTRTRSLTAVADAGIGTMDQPLRIDLGGGALRAVTRDDSIAIDVIAGGVQVDEITAGYDKAGGADVWLSAVQTISMGADGVSGANVTLVSKQGRIGDVAGSGLGLRARGTVSATAAGDIHLDQLDGDLHLVRAHSGSGDVTITVRQGRLVNAARTREIDEERVKELGDIWDEWLTDDENLSRTIARTVRPFEQRVDRAYEEYWRLLDHGTVTDDGYVLNPGGMEMYRARAQAAADAAAGGAAPPVDDEYVISFADALYTEQVELFDDVYGGDWADLPEFAAHADGYSYTVTEAQFEALTFGANWTRAQLELRVNQNALLPVTNTQIYNQEPNIRGVDVTVITSHPHAGGIGSDDASLFIDFSDISEEGEIVLTDEQKAALAAAALPGDVTVIYDADSQPIGIELRQMRSVYVDSSGDVTLVSGGDAFLRSDDSLHVRSVPAEGDVVLAANQSITNEADSGTVAVDVGGNLVLEAGRGSIGTADKPLTVSLTGGGYLSTARANDSLYIETIKTGNNGDGDLRFSGIYAGNTVHLMAQDGSIIGGVDGASGVRINAGTLKLSSAGDVRGMDPGTSLLIRIGSTGTLSGNIGGSARLAAPEQTLVVSDLTTGGGLVLRAASLRFESAVQSGFDAPGTVDITATGHLGEPGAIVMAPNALLHTAGGHLTLRADTFRMLAGIDEAMATIRASAGHNVAIETGAGMELGIIEATGQVALRAGTALADGSGAGRITQIAGGRVSGATHLLTESRGTQTLTGNNTVAGWKAINRGMGDIDFFNAAATLTIAGVETGAMLRITQAGDVTVTGDVSSTAGDVILSTLAGGATGKVTIGAMVRADGGGVAVDAAGSVHVTAAGGMYGGASEVSVDAEDDIVIDGNVETDTAMVILTAERGISVGAGGFVGSGLEGVQATTPDDIVLQGRISTPGVVTLMAGGAIVQHATGRIDGNASLVTVSDHGQSLLGDNAVRRFTATNVASGHIVMHNAADELIVGAVTQRGGDVTIVQTGNLTLEDSVSTRTGRDTAFDTCSMCCACCACCGGQIEHELRIRGKVCRFSPPVWDGPMTIAGGAPLGPSLCPEPYFLQSLATAS